MKTTILTIALALSTFNAQADQYQWVDDHYKVVLINGKEIDLAYTYVLITQAEWYRVAINTAFLVRCPAQGVTNQFLIGE